MAVELNNLYKEIYYDYDIRLLTESCFEKKIGWVHIVENSSFTYLLHGDELVFNSGLNYESQEQLKDFIDQLISMQAGGLIAAVEEKYVFSEKVIDYCNQLQFPLFRASWKTSFMDVMHRFSEILLDHERNETNLIAALKNAIYYPMDDKLYLSHFERNGFSQDMSYIITILGCTESGTKSWRERLRQFKKSLHYIINKNVIYEDEEMLVILSAGYSVKYLKNEFADLCKKNPDFRLGIGSEERQIQDIFHSYENAFAAYKLTGVSGSGKMLCYDDLGVYQVLVNVKDPDICQIFTEKTLGSLMEHDRENGTDYMDVLECFFQNECNITRTADALFYHKNTLKYKMNAIKRILGYDIMANENRTRIMLSFYMMKLNGV